MLQLDDYQKQVLETQGNICLRSGRQVGKSTVISIKAAQYALERPKSQILVISAVERQAFLLFDKILNYLYEKDKKQILGKKDKPTKSQIKLKNGSVIRCLPTGLDGHGIRGLTIDLLIADEAAFIPDAVWTAVTPMLATTKGHIILLSTPHGRDSYFYRCFNDTSFTPFHVSSESVSRIDKQFLSREKERMTKMQYTQEYLGEFVDDLMQLFPDDLIRQCMKLERAPIDNGKTYFLGVDVARMGGDETVFSIIDRTDRKGLLHVENIVMKNTLITETTKFIQALEKRYNFKKVFIDDGGMGVGVFDNLLEVDGLRRKVVAINNAARALDRDEKRKKKILKEDLYNNLLHLMENANVSLLKDPEIFLSLKSIQYEYSPDLKIFGSYSHITEALIRACWCTRDRSLSLWVR